MSIEQLLFLLLLVALPLLERLIRATRTRTIDSPGDDPSARNGGTIAHRRASAAIPDAASTPPADRGTELPLPALPVAPALPQAVVPAAPEHLRASAGAPRVREPNRMPMTGRRTGQSERPSALPHLAPGDLRRAIVLTTILGPCRAVEPKDVSQLG